jgi:hypothetical protein
MRVVALLVVLMAAGCEQVESSGDVFAPVMEAPPAPVEAPAEEPEVEEFDFEADERVEEDAEPRDLAPDDLAASLGIEVLPEETPEELVVAEIDEPVVMEIEIPEIEIPEAEPEPEAGWSVEVPLEGSWGVRVVAVLRDAQPPRAILGLADGSERVVEPGTLVPEAGLVVMAIGRDAVQLAEVIPKGDHVRIKSHVVEPLYASGSAER